MITLDGIELPTGLLWSDEFASTRVTQTVRRTLDGSVVVFYGEMRAGLPITLESEPDAGIRWTDRRRRPIRSASRLLTTPCSTA